jgi:hypothetical protein
MLSQEDRWRLEDIERHLKIEDPAFVARMRRPARRITTSAVVAVWLVLGTVIPMAATVGILAGWLAALTVATVLAVVAPLIWWLSRRHRFPPANDHTG